MGGASRLTSRGRRCACFMGATRGPQSRRRGSSSGRSWTAIVSCLTPGLPRLTGGPLSHRMWEPEPLSRLGRTRVREKASAPRTGRGQLSMLTPKRQP
eukprot:3373691-Amphidinium_carterae.1